MKLSKQAKSIVGIALLICLLVTFSVRAWADSLTFESGTAHGSYRHPETGVIEDSGGEASEALGQSMVGSVVTSQAMLETDESGNQYISLRFGLMSNISSVSIQVQSPGDSTWTDGEAVCTAQGEDTEDYRVKVPGRDAILRAECYVEAMGRSVIFYITVDDWEEGNTGGFVPMSEEDTQQVNEGGSQLLEKVQGLTTGGSAALAAGDEESETAADNTKTTISLDVSAWFTLFVVVFVAAFLAGGLLLAVYWMLVHYKKRPVDPEENFAEHSAEDDFDSVIELDDWNNEE